MANHLTASKVGKSKKIEGAGLMRPITRIVKGLDNLDPLLESMRSTLGYIVDLIGPDIDMLELNSNQLRDALIAARTSDQIRIPVIHKIAVMKADERVIDMVEWLAKLEERTFRHVAQAIYVGGFGIFDLKIKKKKKKTAKSGKGKGKREDRKARVHAVPVDDNSGGPGGGVGVDSGNPRAVPAPKFDPGDGFPPTPDKMSLGPSKAETWPIGNIKSAIEIVIETRPDVYYAAWSNLKSKAAKWWHEALREVRLYLSGVLVLLSAPELQARPTSLTISAALELAEEAKGAKRLKQRMIALPPHVLGSVDTEAAALEVVRNVDSVILDGEQMRQLRERVSKIHGASGRAITETLVLTAIFQGMGKWGLDLEAGAMYPLVSASMPLIARRARSKNLPRMQKVLRIAGSRPIGIEFGFRSEPVTDKSCSTYLDVTMNIRAKVFTEAARKLLAPLHGKVKADFTPEQILAGVVSQIRPNVEGAIDRETSLEGEFRDDKLLLFLTSAVSTEVNKVGLKDSLRLRSRSSMRSVLGSSESNFAMAKAVCSGHSDVVSPVDAYDRMEDVDNSLRLSVTLVLAVHNVDSLHNPKSVKIIQSSLMKIARMGGAAYGETLPPSQEEMIADYLILHGPLKVVKARSTRGRTVVAHSDHPGRSFDVYRRITAGKGSRRFKINLDGALVIVKQDDGWTELAL